MPQNIWQRCKGRDHVISFNIDAWRMVESQHSVATRMLVDSLDEHDILEELIEVNKPSLANDLLGLHYLLYTPFRYPPLKYGSRFGTQLERSIWYGSLDPNTAMAETAYYRFNFLRASKAVFGTVVTNLTGFSAPIKTNQGMDLTQPPFSGLTRSIASPDSYQESQSLGTKMRQDNIESFYYQSARDKNAGKNIALFTPKAFSQKKPHSNSFQSWQCIVNQKVAEFVRLSAITAEARSFPIDDFLSNDELPFPAK